MRSPLGSNRTLGGQQVDVSSPQGRFAADATLIDGRTLDHASARGKHLFLDFDDLADLTLHIHLGLIGSFHVKQRSEEGTAASRARLRLEGRNHVAELRGPMICALIDEPSRQSILHKLGPDPLHEPDVLADGAGRAWSRISQSRKVIAELLLDQSVLAGVGNVYRCEVLFRHRIDPFTPGRELGRRLWDSLWDDLVALLPLGAAFSQILTMQDQVDAAAELVGDGSAPQSPRDSLGSGSGTTSSGAFTPTSAPARGATGAAAGSESRSSGAGRSTGVPAASVATNADKL